MDARMRALRREQIGQAAKVAARSVVDQPTAGWVKTMRQALGMTLESLGKRLGVTRAAAHELERSEANGSVTVKRLRSAAEAMNCELVVLFVPREHPEVWVQRLAMAEAQRRLNPVRHSMVMEEQPVKKQRHERMIEELADELVKRGDQSLWTKA